jgi:hypothetical protein
MVHSVSDAFARLGRAAASLGRQARTVLRGDLLGTKAGRRSAIWTGLLAVGVGTTLGAYVTGATQAVEWSLSIAVALAWAAARLIVMRLANSGLAEEARDGLTSAWAAGLLPYAAGITPVLYVASWIGSLVLTRYYLDRLALPRVDSRSTMLWVAGFEIAAAAAVWISGNLAILLPVSR